MSDDGTNRPEDADATRPIDHAETVPMTPVQADPAPEESPETDGRRTALILISILAGVLLIAVIVLVVLLLTGGSDEAEPVAAPSPTATETTEPEPTESEEPEDDTDEGGDDASGGGGSTDGGGGDTTPAPVFTTTAYEPEIANCDGVSSVPLRFQWMSDGAEQAWFGIGTTDAKAAPYEEVFPNEEVYEGVSFQCSEESEIYTVTLEGPGGITSHTFEVVRG
ncbi:hypothetical protein [Agromyces rhizosphaerae]|nr:hypothetical protein [Agromyces rhizosphaerae]